MTYQFHELFERPSRNVRHLKRIARHAERRADEWAGRSEPWALSNMRLQQNLMSDALGQYYKLIRKYLEIRAQRKV